MSRNRFVSPDTRRLDLSDGDWIEVKVQLGVAEEKRLESAMFRGMTAGRQVSADMSPEDVEVRIDASKVYMEKLHLYLVDWSFTDGGGKRVKCTHQAIDQLDPQTADECLDVLNKFLDERDEERKRPPTESSSELRSA